MWTLSPAFRAERSDTNRHLAEFWMLEAEWGDVSPSASTTPGGVRGICAFVEGMLRHTLRALLERDRTREDLDVLSDGHNRQSERREQINKAVYSPKPWTVMTYTEAIEHLRGSGQTFEFEPVWGKSLQSEHEKWLADKIVGGPVFVVDYPVGLKPFYMRLNSAACGQEGTVACFDLLVPGVGELVGGSVREEREEVLIKRMRECGLLGDTGELGAYQWYLDLRKYGGAPHVGFGMGFERLVSWVGGVENVKECVPVPRWAGRMML
jgi:asparaginyl-tRNA synthetase